MDASTPDELILKHLQGTLTGPERARLEDWLRRDTLHRRQFEQSLTAWKSASDLAAGLDFATGSEWGKLAAHLHEDTAAPVPAAPAGRSISFGARKWAWRAAAAIALLVVAWLGVSRLTDRGPRLLTQRTEAGSKAQYTLPDGTVVWLNAQSRLSYPEAFAGATREVTLAGEAFFEVKRDPRRPFVIRAGRTLTQVLGTSFNLRVEPGSNRVTVKVVSGKVGFAPLGRPARRVLLTAGMRGNYLPAADSVYGEPDAPAWQSSKLVFKDTPLREMLPALRKQYGVPVEVADPSLLNCLFTSTFEGVPLTEVLEAVALALDLRYVYRDGKYLLTGKGCA
ncbi:MAG: FecR domain-containing protein [Cytophagales bacterium]|nr:FecR domain-containing protein [Cytophagales bacterium]